MGSEIWHETAMFFNGLDIKFLKEIFPRFKKKITNQCFNFTHFFGKFAMNVIKSTKKKSSEIFSTVLILVLYLKTTLTEI